MPRPLTPEKQRRLMAMADRGDDAYAIAAVLGCGVQTVRRHAGKPVARRTRKHEIVRRLRALSVEMHEVATLMDYFGGFANWAQHGKQLAGAAAIAKNWAASIAADDP